MAGSGDSRVKTLPREHVLPSALRVAIRLQTQLMLMPVGAGCSPASPPRGLFGRPLVVLPPPWLQPSPRRAPSRVPARVLATPTMSSAGHPAPQ